MFSGTAKKWETFSRLPSPVTLRQALSRYLDITSVPSPQILKFLAAMVSPSMLLTESLSRILQAMTYIMTSLLITGTFDVVAHDLFFGGSEMPSGS